MMLKTDKIYIAGHKGMVGSAILRKLKQKGYQNFVLKSSSELDLRNQKAVEDFFLVEKPDIVFLAAAKVGGINANNSFKATFFYDNVMISTNVINSSKVSGVKKLLFLGSSCIYPKMANQPIDEEQLLAGYLEPTNEAYAIAKISGLKMCDFYREQYGCDFISAMPTNLYGPNDNYNLESSHVIPALLRKFHEAKMTGSLFVEVWGTGAVLREFLHVDDLAEASVFLMSNYSDTGHVNVGTGIDISINNLAETIKEIVGFKGEIKWNSNYPDGTPRKLLNVDKMRKLGWNSSINLKEGLTSVYKSWLND